MASKSKLSLVQDATVSHIPTFTRHAEERARQRNFSLSDVHYVLRYSRRIRTAGACFCFLGQRDIPFTDRRSDAIQRLEGLIVVLSNDGTQVLTLYKNKNGLSDIRKKAKFNQRKVA
ncbi:MAG TPA: DUF4258 domain-containing protein [Chloroflexia bacterium]|nr:DUF4258 domain-containing protein [Chloroflexia bacterium]